MLVRPSVTPKDRNDYLAGCSKRHDPDDNLTVEQSRSTVRFHPEVAQIKQSTDGDLPTKDEEEEEDFPLRRKPVRGRKATGIVPAKSTKKADDIPSVSQAPRFQAGVSPLSDEVPEGSSKTNAGLSMGMASKIAGAMKKSAKQKRSGESNDEEIIDIPVSNLTLREKDGDQVNEASKPSKGAINSAYGPEAFAPVFAEGISLFSPKATYNGKESKPTPTASKSSTTGKHAFARFVESARHHAGLGGSGHRKEVKEEEKIPEIAPGPRAKLLELAKSAKLKAQQRPSMTESSTLSRDDDPSWRCAGINQGTALLQDSLPLPSLTVQAPTPTSTLNDKEEGKDYRRGHHSGVRKSSSRSKLAEESRLGRSDEVVYIGRDDGKEDESRHQYEQSHRHRRERSRSRHRHHNDSSHDLHRNHPEREMIDRDYEEREHRRPHRSRHQEHRVHQSSSHPPVIPPISGLSSDPHHHHQKQRHHHAKPSDHVPDKRKGKVLDPGAETQRLNLALSMARTRMEMEIAEQQEVHANTKSNGGVEKTVKDEEEKAWLEEAYEEAVKKEVEYQYLYEAHALGGLW